MLKYNLNKLWKVIKKPPLAETACLKREINSLTLPK